MTADRVLAWVEQADRPVQIREIAEGLGIRRADRRALQRVLRELVEAGTLYRGRGRRFAVPGRLRLVVGRLKAVRRASGGGYVVPEDGGQDVFVRSGDLGSAVDGDRVVARLEGVGRGGRPEGSVVRVLERGRRTIVGRLHRPAVGRQPTRRRDGKAGPASSTGATDEGVLGWVVPEDPALTRHVLAAGSEAGPAAEGDVVVVRVTDWGDARRGPSGVIERVLGPADAPGVDVLAIVHGHELPTEFAAAAVEEAERLRARGIPAEQQAGRTDFRSVLVFTIDPSDARDHDDALSFRPAADGSAEVGVHIADVSHYVGAGGPIDAEARERATSVYLVDGVIPMLPEPLSSDLCSLLPGVDRLTVSVVFRVDSTGAVQSATITPSIVRSRHRLTYEEAQAVLDGDASIDAETDDALRRLAAFARGLRARREARGSLDFDLPEARVFLDAAGQPIAIRSAPRHESHRLVEDLMLLANETVGQRALRSGLPFLYRVHEPPDETRLAELAELARAMGYPTGKGPLTPGSLQRLLAGVEADVAGRLFATLALRSMKAARYSERDVGHFGLAVHGYTHFTSPIRRYPDLVVHRLVRAGFLDRAAGRSPVPLEQLATIARHASDRERVAQAAERDSVNLKKVRFMERHVGDVFEGTISDVRPFGFFVLPDEHFVEGLVHVSNLGDDYYRWVEERFLLKGERTGRRFALGQRIRVRLSSVDVEQRRIDFVPEAIGTRARPERRPGSRRRTKRRRD